MARGERGHADAPGRRGPQRERAAHAGQRPRQRVLQERGVQQRVHDERGEGGGDRRAPRALARTAEQARHRQPHQREVGQQTGDALLGRDRDRDRVRGGRRALGRHVLGAAVLPREGSRPPPLQRALGEQLHAALDQVVAPAGRRVGGLRAAEVDPDGVRCQRHEGGARGHRDQRRDHRATRAPAQPAQHGEAGEQRGEARLREGQHERGPQHEQQRPGGEDVAAPRAPQQPRRRQQHGDGQEAPVDVGVEEQRVDPEVVLELVGGDDLRVEEQVARGVLDEADRGQRDRHAEEHPQRDAQDARRPPAAAQEHEQQREGNVEEDDVLQRAVEVDRVRRLRRVEREVGGERPLEETRPRRGLLAGVGVDRRRPRRRGTAKASVPAATTR